MVSAGRGEMMYVYGMKERGCSLGTQPKDGLDSFTESADPKYYDILYYTRELTKEEIRDYELDYLGQS